MRKTNPTPKTPTSLDEVEVPCFSDSGASAGNRTFTPGVVYNYPNIPLLKEAVRRQQGRLRRGTASTKTRAEVSGSGKKPWRQKGTGRARAGTRKSPLWRGGGATFGPKPRSYDYGLPKKQRRLAIRHALLSKLIDGESRIVEGLAPSGASTKQVRDLLSKMEINESCLIAVGSDVAAPEIQNLVLSCRNLRGVEVLVVKDFDTLSLLRHRSLVFPRHVRSWGGDFPGWHRARRLPTGARRRNGESRGQRSVSPHRRRWSRRSCLPKRWEKNCRGPERAPSTERSWYRTTFQGSPPLRRLLALTAHASEARSSSRFPG